MASFLSGSIYNSSASLHFQGGSAAHDEHTWYSSERFSSRSQLAFKPPSLHSMGHSSIILPAIAACKAEDRPQSNSGRDNSGQQMVDANSMMLLTRKIKELRRRELTRRALAEDEKAGRPGVLDAYVENDLDAASKRGNKFLNPDKNQHYQSIQEDDCQQEDMDMVVMNHSPDGFDTFPELWRSQEYWMDWEVRYKAFYREEVIYMMARLQKCLLESRPSHSLLLLLCTCLSALVGAFHVLSCVTSWFIPNLLIFVGAHI